NLEARSHHALIAPVKFRDSRVRSSIKMTIFYKLAWIAFPWTNNFAIQHGWNKV
ncbi:hypothetical protein A2U01_0068766, partial [Trifolium medium]|nr:hypothetical protein [Trifolium medium]